MPRSSSNPAVKATSSIKDEVKNKPNNIKSSRKRPHTTNTMTNALEKPNNTSVKYKILKCVISVSNIIPSERKHNTRVSNRHSRCTSTKPLCSLRKSINYAKLNDGLDPFTPPSPKRQKRVSHRPRKDGPYESRVIAHMSNDKDTRSLDLEHIMDTTLDEDNNGSECTTDAPTCDDNESVLQNQPEMAGVTGMDGGTLDLPDLESETNNQQTTPSPINRKVDGVTDDQNHPDNANLEDVIPPASTDCDGANDLPTRLITEIPIDGVTEGSPEMLALLASADETGTLATPATEHNNASVDGVTHDRPSVEQDESGNNSINLLNASTSIKSRENIMDGVTPAPTGIPVTENNNSEPTEESVKSKNGSDQDVTLDGVTSNRGGAMADVSANTKALTNKTTREIIANCEFPEKSLLLGGGTSNNLDNSMDITNLITSNSTLPDLVASRGKQTATEYSNALPLKKTPTECLLDVFGLPIPSELEEDDTPAHFREYHTTEDEDEAIDGLLALSKQPSKSDTHKGNEKNNKTPTGSNNTNETKHKPKRTSKKKKSKKSKKYRETASKETEKLEKQLEQMNITSRRSRPTTKPTATDKNLEVTTDNVSGQKPKQKRRDESSDSPGSPPGVFKLTHHKLLRKETKERSYKCGQCKHKAKNMENLKKHYSSKHKKVLCSVCNQTFESDIILARHTYTHYDKRFFCKKCKEGFYFASELKKHKVSHVVTPSFQYMVAGCGKWFKRVAEVNVHMEVHKNKTWKCTKCNEFSTTCEKYLKDHYRTSHNPNSLPYGCAECGKGFKYRMQLKRHHNDINACSRL